MKKIGRLNRRLVMGLLTTLLFISGCAPTGTPTGGTGGFDPTIIILLALMLGFFYFTMIRPQRQRQKEHQSLLQELKRGDAVITAGGIYGRVESLDEKSVVLKVESGALIRVARGGIISRQGNKERI